MNQGKLEAVKQEMARMNIDILVISEVKWTEMDEFNSENSYIYYIYYWLFYLILWPLYLLLYPLPLEEMD